MKPIFAFFLVITLFGAGCGHSEYGSSEYGSSESAESEPENPYSVGTGHYAGFEWAERTGNSCSGNSSSFIEGCEEYYNQLGE